MNARISITIFAVMLTVHPASFAQKCEAVDTAAMGKMSAAEFTLCLEQLKHGGAAKYAAQQKMAADSAANMERNQREADAAIAKQLKAEATAAQEEKSAALAAIQAALDKRALLDGAKQYENIPPVSGIDGRPIFDNYHKNAIRSGVIPVRSVEDARWKFDDVHSGTSLVFQPKVDGDGRFYSIDGFVTLAKPWGFIASVAPPGLTGQQATTYFAVNVPPSMRGEYADKARVNGQVRIIGKYTKNIEVPLASRGVQQAPVFDMVYIQ